MSSAPTAPTPTQLTLLAGILQEEAGKLQHFLTLLDEEAAALTGNDPEQLEAVIARKNELADTLQRLERQKLRVVATTAGHDERVQRALLAEWQTLPPLAERWEAVKRIAQACRKKNQQNGALLREKQQLTQQALAILLGVDTQLDTYTGSGIPRAQWSSPSRKLGSA